MPSPTERGAAIIGSYSELVGEQDDATNLSDLIADLFHWATVNEIDWDQEIARGVKHAIHEINNPDEYL